MPSMTVIFDLLQKLPLPVHSFSLLLLLLECFLWDELFACVADCFHVVAALHCLEVGICFVFVLDLSHPFLRQGLTEIIVLAWQVDESVLCRKNKSRCVYFLFCSYQTYTALQTPPKASFSIQELVKTFTALNQKLTQIQIQRTCISPLSSLPILRYQIDLQILMLQYIFLDITIFKASRYEEVAQSKFFNRSRFHPRTDVQFKLEAGAEDGKIKEVVCMWFDSCELVQLMQIKNKSVSDHLMDGLIVADGFVVASYDT